MIQPGGSSAGSSPSSSAGPSNLQPALVAAPPSPALPQQLPQKVQRIIPCLQCRAIRRSCAWPEGGKSCARCLKLGKSCSGPSKRAREALDVYKKDAPLPNVAPSSPTSTMASTQLSYALTYHLVNVFLEFGSGIRFVGIDGDDKGSSYLERFRETNGRVSGMADNDELLTLVYMLAGAQVTNHSAVVGPPSPSLTVPTFGTFRLASEVPNIQAIGPLRRQSMLAVVDLLRKRLSTLDYTDGRSLANAASRLAVAWMSLTTFTSREIEPERHGALGGCVLRGVYLLGIARPDQVEERKNIVVYTQGLAREELRTSYSNGYISVVTPDLMSLIFGPPTSPLPFPILGARELAVILGAECTPKELLGLYDAHGLAVESYLDSLARLLVFSPLDHLPAAVRQCWMAYEACSAYLGELISGILDDDRYKAMTPEAQSRRPCAFVINASTAELLACMVLCGCHKALLRKGDEGDMLLESEEIMMRSLSSISASVVRMLGLPTQAIGTFLTMSRLTLTVELYRGPVLDRWAREYPLYCENMLKGLRFAAFGLPDAARLVAELEAVLAATASTDEMAAMMVDGALSELGGGIRRLSLD